VENPREAGLIFPFRLEEAPAEPTAQNKKRPAKSKKGIFKPLHNSENEKYNRKNLPKDIKKISKRKIGRKQNF